MFKTPLPSEEERRLVGYLTKKKKASGKKVNVYFNKKNSSTKKTKYFNGKFYSNKNKTTFTYRSSYELKYFFELEADDNVINYLSEGMQIPYVDSEGEKKTYIPDLMILYADGSVRVVEIKPKAMLRDVNVQRKAAACRTYIRNHYKDKDISYKFITEVDLFKTNKEYTEFIEKYKEYQ